MITFLDGPAAGKKLLLRSAPEILRVVIDPTGKVDALDQPGDEPRPGEAVFFYRRTREAGVVMVHGSRRSAVYPLAEYAHDANRDHSHYCWCGIARRAPHVIGEDGCPRRMVDAPVRAGTHPELGCPMWRVDGVEITEFTMNQQRGYHRHPCGCWSSRDDLGVGSRSPGSENSIDA